MSKLYNLARMTTDTTGTGDVILVSPVPGYLSFDDSGVQDGDVVTYGILDGSNSEVGRGTYTTSTTSLQRTTIIKSTNSNSAINLSGGAQVFITAIAEDIINQTLITAANDFLVGASNGVATKKTLAQTKTILGIDDLIEGPASAVDSTVAKFDGTTGKLIKDGGTFVDNLVSELDDFDSDIHISSASSSYREFAFEGPDADTAGEFSVNFYPGPSLQMNWSVSTLAHLANIQLSASTASSTLQAYADLIQFGNFIEISESSTPATPGASYGAIYPKSDHKLYFLNSSGVEYLLSNLALANLSGSNSGDETTASIATKSIEDAINDGTINKAPSENAVYDALALKANLASPALTGTPTAPTASQGDNSTKVATTAYVDAAFNDSDIKLAVRAASQGNLSFTRSGNVYTATALGVLLKATIDSGWSSGAVLAVGDRLLLANQTSNVDNGIVTITDLGTIGTNAVLTRSTDMDSSVEVTSEMRVPVSEGTDANLDYKLSAAGPFTLNTTALPFTKAGGPPTGSAGGSLSGTYPNPTVATNANLTGDVTSVGNATTLTNAPVIAKVLTSFASGAGTVSATDSILQAFQKVVGNIALKLTANSPITGATKTKITYDANGLVTSGADIAASDLPTGIDAAKINTGVVSNTEFNYLDGVTSAIQTQIDGKQASGATAGGDLAGTYPNPTVAQVTNSFALKGVLTPAQITADQNNYNPTGLSTASTLRLTSDASRNITGIAGGASGRVLILQNANATNIPIVLVQDASSSVANRLYLSGLASVVLGYQSSLIFEYDGTISRWVLVGTTPQGTAITKASIVDADEVFGLDSVTTLGFNTSLIRTTWTSIKSFLKTYFDTLYQASGSYQPLDSDLTTIAGLTATTDNFIQSKSSAWASRTIAQVVTDLRTVLDSVYQASLGFTAENSSNKDASGGYSGLTLFKINFKNAANTFTNFLTNATTAARTYTFPDKDITVAGLVDITGTNSNTNTGDVTLGAFGSTPDAKGASISGQVVTMQPADGTNPGAVSTTTQTIAGNKTFTGDVISLASYQTSAWRYTDYSGTWDFFSTGSHGGWSVGAISTGTITLLTSIANHHGIVQISNNGAANAGQEMDFGDANSILLAGGEVFEFVFRHDNSTSTVQRYGFQDLFSTALPVDGAWIHIAGATLDGRTANNSTRSTTGTNYALTTTVWYRLRVTVNTTSLVTYELYTCSDGVRVWTDTLTTNIPSTAGRETSAGLVAYKTVTTNTTIATWDWIYLHSTSTLTR